MPAQVAAYRHFGATLANERWSWSARASDGWVVLTLWKDELNYRTKPASYDLFGHPRLAEWTDRSGNLERIENLKWATDHAGGKSRVLIATAVDERASPREIDEAYPQPNMVMRLVDLSERTGEFSAVIDNSHATRT